MFRNKDNFYLIAPSISGVDKKAKEELIIILEKSGFRYKEGGMGGGPADIYHEVVAFLNIHALLSSLLLNVVAGYLVKILDKLYSWYKSNYKEKEKYSPSVNIYLYSKLKKGNAIFIWFYINKRYTKKDVINKIKSVKK